MPKYIYECGACEETLEVRHSIKEKLSDCPTCKEEGSLKRIPSMPTIVKTTTTRGNDKPGTLVKRFIEDAKSEISSEKRDLRKREYKE